MTSFNALARTTYERPEPVEARKTRLISGNLDDSDDSNDDFIPEARETLTKKN
jgi:hypothetical protein